MDDDASILRFEDYQIYVSNLPLHISRDDILKILKLHKDVGKIYIKPPQNGGTFTYCFIHVNSASSAFRVIECLNGSFLNDRKIFAALSNDTKNKMMKNDDFKLVVKEDDALEEEIHSKLEESWSIFLKEQKRPQDWMSFQEIIKQAEAHNN